MLETLGSSSIQRRRFSASVKLGETLQQLFSFCECLRWLHFLSFTLRPALQVPSPRSYQEEPSLGAGSKCPNGLVTVSAIQTQTAMYSSVPCRGRQNDRKTGCVTTDTPQERRAGGPSANRTGIFLSRAHHHLRLQKRSPRRHLT